MPIEAIEEKLRSIPESYLPQIMEYLSFIEYKSMQKNPDSLKEEFYRPTGILKGKIWMADDFDETPECFKDYM